ncbi:hypothetical protein B0H14DRAFT_2596475 [Mycena olivaceomarginata]|nr:hypothetical protein B0H14DRAFT_2596475 [Mycena olivaceomarginata]
MVEPPTGSQLDDDADGDSVLALAMELAAMRISPTELECEAARPSNSNIRRQHIKQWAASVTREMDNSWDISAQIEFAEAQPCVQDHGRLAENQRMTEAAGPDEREDAQLDGACDEGETMLGIQ